MNINKGKKTRVPLIYIFLVSAHGMPALPICKADAIEKLAAQDFHVTHMHSSLRGITH